MSCLDDTRPPEHGQNGRGASWFLRTLLAIGLSLLLAAQAHSQEERTKPGPGYFAAFGPFYDGDYQARLQILREKLFRRTTQR